LITDYDDNKAKLEIEAV
jgi:hypothetical protein